MASRVSYPSAFTTAGSPAWSPTEKQPYRGGDAVLTPPPPPPDGIPSDLVAAFSGFQIILNWTDNSSNETSFPVERSLDGASNWLTIGSAPADTPTFADTTVAPGVEYFYRVRARNSGGDTAPSNVDSATVPLVPINSSFCDPTIPEGWVYTAPSVRSYWDDAGILRTAAIDEWQPTFNPFTGECEGIWIEAVPKTNSMDFSFDLTTWRMDGTATAVLSAVADGPDLTTDYSEITVGNVSNGIAETANSPDGANIRAEPSCLMRRTNTSGILVLANDQGTVNGEWNIDLALLPDAWVWVTRDHPAVTIITEFVNAGANGGMWFYSIAGFDLSFDVSYCQYEGSSLSSSSPIKTNGATVLRQANRLVSTELAAFMSEEVGTFVLAGKKLYTFTIDVNITPNTAMILFDARDTTGLDVDVIVSEQTAGGQLDYEGRDSGVATWNIALSGLARNEPFKVAGTYVTNRAQYALNGVPSAEDLSNTLPFDAQFVTMALGSTFNGFSGFMGTFASFQYDPVVATESQLIAATTLQEPAPPTTLTYASWDIWSNRTTRPVPPATTAPDRTFSNITELATELAAACADVGQVTRVRQTANFSISSDAPMTIGVQPGATTILDGDGFDIDAQNNWLAIEYESRTGIDNLGWGPKQQVGGVSYDNTGTGFVGDNGIITFATTLPANLQIGDILAIFNIPDTLDNTFNDPTDGPYIWAREPSQQRFGIRREVTAIDGLAVTVDGHLYEGDTGIYNAIANNVTYPLWGMRMLAKNEDVWIDGMTFLNTNQRITLEFTSLRGVHIIDTEIDQTETVGFPDNKVTGNGSYEVDFWDGVISNRDLAFISEQHGIGSNFATCRIGWFNSGTPGTPPALLGYDAGYMRHVTDTLSADFALALGETDSYYASRVGPSVETCTKDITAGPYTATEFGDHSGGVGSRHTGARVSGDKTSATRASLGGWRGSNNIFDDFIFRASQAQTSPPGPVNQIHANANGGAGGGGSGPESEHNSCWNNIYTNSLFDIDVAGFELSGIFANCYGPLFYIDNTYDMAEPVTDAIIFQFDMSQGVQNFPNAFADEVLPGYVNNKVIGCFINPSFTGAPIHNVVNVKNHGEAFINGPTLNLAGQAGETWNGANSEGNTKVVGRLYVTNKGTNTVVKNVGAGDVSQFEITEAAAPISAPTNPNTFVATASTATTIDLSWVIGGGDRQCTFEIEQSLDGINFWQHIATLGPLETTYIVADLSPNTQYFFRIRARNNIGKAALNTAPVANDTTPTGVSDEAQAVLDLMTNLDPTETQAIIDFVDSQVAAGNWSELSEFQCYALNSVDFGTGWLGKSTASLQGAMTQTPGLGVSKGNNSADYLNSDIIPLSDAPPGTAGDSIAGVWLQTNGLYTPTVALFGTFGANNDQNVTEFQGGADDARFTVNHPTFGVSNTVYDNTADHGPELFSSFRDIGGPAQFAEGAAVDTGDSGSATVGNLSVQPFAIGSRNLNGTIDSGLWTNGVTFSCFYMAKFSTFDLTAWYTGIKALLTDLGVPGVPP